ncbi:hypothetical protein DR66_5946 [Delftia acidovorans]|nr:hypothetical protein DR66_5946 [Delftia acidovorans]
MHRRSQLPARRGVAGRTGGIANVAGQHVEGTLDALGDFFRTLGRVGDGGTDGRNHGQGQLATEGKGLMHARDLWWFRSRQGGRHGTGPAPAGRVDSGRCDALAKDGRQLVHHVQLPAQAGLLGRLRMGSRLSPADPKQPSSRRLQSRHLIWLKRKAARRSFTSMAGNPSTSCCPCSADAANHAISQICALIAHRPDRCARYSVCNESAHGPDQEIV